MRIRNATEADFERIVEIYNASIPGRLATADLTPVNAASRRAWFDALERRLELACPAGESVALTELEATPFWAGVVWSFTSTRSPAISATPSMVMVPVRAAMLLVEAALTEALGSSP